MNTTDAKIAASQPVGTGDLFGFGDETPLTPDWLQAQGFKFVPSSLGREYSDHLELGRLNVWEFNGTGEWLFEDCDRIGLKTRGRLRMLAALLGVVLPNNFDQPTPVENQKP